LRTTVAVEWMAGGSLEDLITAQPGRIPEAVVAYIVSELLHGLAILHDQAGLLHRGVTPRNVLFATTGHVKLTDFSHSALISDAGPEVRWVLLVFFVH